MTLGVPQIIQTTSVSVTEAPGADYAHPVGYNVLTLPNPVTVGNTIVFIGFGGGAGGTWYNGFGSTLPAGWAVLGYNGGITDTVQTTIYTQTATTPVPPSVTVAYGGFSSQCGILMEIANCGAISFESLGVSSSLNVATVSQQGSVADVASLYLGLVFGDDGYGFSYSTPEPSGAVLGANLSVVDLFEGAPGWGAQIICASNNPASLEVTRSATITGDVWYAGLIISAGTVTAPPTAPDSSGFVGVGLNGNGGTQDVVYAVVERTTVCDGVPYRYYTVEMMASRLLGSKSRPGGAERH